jgi:hypothetical protein
MKDDTRFLQMSTPVQPGNSGGALVDMSGSVVGVVVAQLNAVARSVPQNVNFAIQPSFVMNFLSVKGTPPKACTRPAPAGAILVWAIVGSVGAATVLSFTILAEYFPSEIAGQANAALNFLHIGGAFILQYAIGIIVDIWGSTGGHYPIIAYQAAFTIILCLQIMAWSWYFGSELVTVRFAFPSKHRAAAGKLDARSRGPRMTRSPPCRAGPT